jgi:hypothetical protein
MTKARVQEIARRGRDGRVRQGFLGEIGRRNLHIDLVPGEDMTAKLQRAPLPHRRGSLPLRAKPWADGDTVTPCHPAS